MASTRLRHAFLVLLLALFGGGVAPRPAAAQCKLRLDFSNPSSGWTIVARDEFDDSAGTGRPNPKFWQVRPGGTDQYAGWGSEWYDTSDSSLVTVSGGAAHLRATRWRDAQGNPLSVQKGTYSNGAPRYVRYRSGMLRSVGPFVLPSYGAYEARLKLPANGEDAWPTFWLWAHQGTEIDMLDGARIDNWPYAYPSNPGLLTNVIDWHHPSSTQQYPNCGRLSKLWSDPWWSQATLLSRQYNTYTMVWTPAKITFFFNGREIQTVPRSAIQSVQQWSELFINLQTTSWTNATADFQLDVDYVRLLRPTCMVNGTCPDDYVMDASSYKSSYEALNHDISQPVPNWEPSSDRDPEATTTWAKVSAEPGSIAVGKTLPGQASTQVFYRGTNDRLYLAHNARGNDWTVTALPYTSGYDVAGDVAYIPCLQLAMYKGADGRLQGYYLDALGGWQHTWLTGAAGQGNELVDGQAGAVTILADEGIVAYRSQHATILVFTIDPSCYSSSATAAYAPTTPLRIPNGSATDVAGDLVYDQRTRSIFYRGQDNQLQAYWWDGQAYTHARVDSAQPMAAKPTALVATATGIFYVSQDDNICCVTRNKRTGHFATAVLPMAPYTYGDTGYPMAYKVKGSLASTPDGTHLLYQGYDGRLQMLYLDGIQWQHAWLDDYWNTNEFCSFSTKQGSGLASVTTDSRRTFYCDAYNHLRYFGWEPCEVTECGNMHANLH
ncbi:family 16 glycosylhydrolase [Hymenobacter setariae]|uniref:Family 16 glycosylhydrolase n=1 Tax=Hymenobacter setariae TaxID=2594794 RepID=A0A558C4A1_9BACT|nr:family 16 glycosylhydrolase [Hymenobacter setariae]TVT43527.1 family 16 glycosylhydrolase [Hymenobacter setariae]